MAKRRPISEGDAVMFVNAEGRLVPEQGVWLALGDEGADADGVARVEIERVVADERLRAEARRLWVTDTVEERLAWTLMRGPGE